MRHVDPVSALERVNPRSDAIRFEQVARRELQSRIGKKDVQLALVAAICEAQYHGWHQPRDDASRDCNHEMLTGRLTPFEVIAVIIGEDCLTSLPERLLIGVPDNQTPLEHFHEHLSIRSW